MSSPATPTNSDAAKFHEVSVNSWEEFEQKLKDVRNQQSGLPLLFRGQELSTWSLSTTLERNAGLNMRFKDYYRRISMAKPHVESFTDNSWLTPKYPEIEQLGREDDAFCRLLSSGQMPAYSFMAHLRHHGFPSPLLDWSRSPYVAAYFAFAKASSAKKESVSIYLFSEASMRRRGNQIPLIFRYGPFVKTHRRHFLHAYSLFASEDALIETLGQRALYS